MSLATVMLVLFLQLLGYLLYRYVKTAYFSKLLKIPGLEYHPIYGNVKESMQGEALESSTNWVKRFGGVVRFYHLFGEERLLLADIDAIRHVMITKSSNYERRNAPIIIRLVPKGLLGISGDAHKLERRLLNPAFNADSVSSLMPLFKQKADKLVTKLSSLLDNNKALVNMQMFVTAATLDVIGAAAFRSDFHSIENPGNENMEFMGRLTNSQRRSLTNNIPLYQYLPTAANKRFQQVFDKARAFCHDIITGFENLDETDKLTVLARLKLARYDDSDQGLSYESLQSHILTFLIAGHETSSLTLTWLLLELAKKPTIQNKLYEELSSVDTNKLDMEGLEKLKYLEACVKESLRLYPAAPSVLRTSKGDDIINGYYVPAGTNVVVHMGVMMRTCVEDGEVFRPERFLDDSFPSHYWLPFGIGTHACIGNKFAFAEIKVLVLYIINNFILSCPEGVKITRKYNMASLLCPSEKLKLFIEARA